jgi:hypothetical protein
MTRIITRVASQSHSRSDKQGPAWARHSQQLRHQQRETLVKDPSRQRKEPELANTPVWMDGGRKWSFFIEFLSPN